VKSTLPIVAIAMAVALTLVGCSGGGGGGNTTPPKTNNPAPPAAAKTFAESDLVKILNSANASLGAGGTVTDLGPVTSSGASSTGDVYERIQQAGGSLTPAACGTLWDKIESDARTLGNNSSAYAAKLAYGSSILSATSSSKPVDVSKLTSVISSDLTGLTNQCTAMQVSIKGVSAAFNYTQGNATTDAKTTYSYTESGSFGTSPVTSVAIIAVDGNLLIGFEGLSGVSLDDGVKAVNAVLAAAK
jgi:hypothetical protein